MSRRVIPSGSSEAPSGNSRSRKARNSGRSLELRETSPICPCHRWHPEQSVGGLTGRSRSSCAASTGDVPGRRPLHVGDLRDGASVGTGVAVAVEAPAHAEGRHLGDGFHLVDAAVAGDAADSCRHVRVVGEIGVVGKLVDANPAHRPAALGAFPNRCEQRAVPLHGLMAVHAGLRGRNVRDGRNLDRGVTVSAIETKLADVELVAVRDGLNGTVAHVCVPRGKEVPDARDREHRSRGCPRWRPRSGVCSTKGERSGPMARTPGRRRTVAQAASPRMDLCHILAHRRILRRQRPECRRSKPESYPRTRTWVKRAALRRYDDRTLRSSHLRRSRRPAIRQASGRAVERAPAVASASSPPPRSIRRRPRARRRPAPTDGTPRDGASA